MGVLVRELGTLYSAFVRGAADPLPPLPVQYADYAAWQRAAMQEQIAEARRATGRPLWPARPALLELPTDRPRPAQQDYAGSYMPVPHRRRPHGQPARAVASATALPCS